MATETAALPRVAAATVVAQGAPPKPSRPPPPAPAPQASSVELEFAFSSAQDLYGFVNVGAKICEVVPGSLASRLGVAQGWHIARVDGEYLFGAWENLCRKIPSVTTDEVRELLGARRTAALRAGRPVVISFWTSPRPSHDLIEDESFEASTSEELKHILICKYGSLVSAWETALDADNSGELDYKEFVAACRAVGFTGSLKNAYSELDKDGQGTISLSELDPTCKMDFSKGRCAVCTLPNPCERHDAHDQKRITLEKRRGIMEGKDSPATLRT